MISLFLLVGCNLSYIVDLFVALHELASASVCTLLKLASSVRARLKPYWATLTRWKCPQSVFQHWKGGEGVGYRQKRCFLKLWKDAERKHLFCSNVSTLLSMIAGQNFPIQTIKWELSTHYKNLFYAWVTCDTLGCDVKLTKLCRLRRHFLEPKRNFLFPQQFTWDRHLCVLGAYRSRENETYIFSHNFSTVPTEKVQSSWQSPSNELNNDIFLGLTKAMKDKGS